MAMFPSSALNLSLFSASFKEPSPPVVATELRGTWLQHKWNENVSHIASGYWYNSAYHAKVRLDESYLGGLGSSLFDFTDINPSDASQVMNKQVIVKPSVGSRPSCFAEYVSIPAFPLVTATLLQDAKAVYGGGAIDPLIGEAQMWHFLLAGLIPVTVYLDEQNPPVLKGYDFWGENLRTKAVTRFFGHESAQIGEEVFANFPCKK